MNLTSDGAREQQIFPNIRILRWVFETVSKYGRLLGIGGTCRYNCRMRHPGSFPTVHRPMADSRRMSTFGESYSGTPFATTLGRFPGGVLRTSDSLLSAVPPPPEEVEKFRPLHAVKRELEH